MREFSMGHKQASFSAKKSKKDGMPVHSELRFPPDFCTLFRGIKRNRHNTPVGIRLSYVLILIRQGVLIGKIRSRSYGQHGLPFSYS